MAATSDPERDPEIQREFNKEDEEEGEQEQETPTWLRVLKAAFSHVGLTIIVLAYSFAGGVIFNSLEGPNELSSCIESKAAYISLLNDSVKVMWEIARQKDLDEEAKRAAFYNDLDAYRLGFQGGDFAGDIGEDCAVSDWTIVGGLLFCITVVTTIGYGHIAPKTQWGRIVCITYSMFGIPILLILLANIGDVLADMFKFIYSNCCCCGCCRVKEEKEKVEEINALQEPQLAWRTDADGKPIGPGPTLIDKDEMSDTDSDDEDDEEEAVTVPLTITIMVIGAWVFMGALIFSALEPTWEIQDSAYFSFITVTTIGFGDMSPGLDDVGSVFTSIKLCITGVYMLIGMALISMCFTLMQDEVVAKINWLGVKLGIVKGNDDDDYSDSSSDEEDWDPDDPYGDKDQQKEAALAQARDEDDPDEESSPIPESPRGPSSMSRVVSGKGHANKGFDN